MTTNFFSSIEVDMGVERIGRASAGVITAAALVSVLGGCADTRGGPVPYNVSNFGAPDPPSASLLPSDFAIAPLDTLSITIFGVEDLSRDYTVDVMGNITMPLIGDVHAAGLTPREFDQALTEKLGKKYFQNPDVTVSIKSSQGRQVTVDGAVGRAGSYPVVGPTTLMQAVALAGGTRDNANARRIVVFRVINGQRQAAAFDLESIRHGEMKDPEIFAGDVIIVDGSGSKSTLRKLFQTLPIIGLFRPFIL